MAVGIIIGAAFGTIISSLVKDVIMPTVGLALGNINFSNLAAILKQGTTLGPYASVAAAQAGGAVTLNYGLFINTIISFLIIALVVFFLVVRQKPGCRPQRRLLNQPRRQLKNVLFAIPISRSRLPAARTAPHY